MPGDGVSDEYEAFALKMKKLIENGYQRNAEWWKHMFTTLPPEQQEFVIKEIHENELREKLKAEAEIVAKLAEFAQNDDHLVGFLDKTQSINWIKFEDQTSMEFHMEGSVKISMPSEVFFSGPTFVAKKVFTVTKHAYDTSGITKKHWTVFVNKLVSEKTIAEVESVSEDDLVRENVARIIRSLVIVGTFKEFQHEEAVERDNRLYVSPGYLLERLDRIKIRVGMKKLGEATRPLRDEKRIERKTKTGVTATFWGFHIESIRIYPDDPQERIDGSGIVE
jgi:hypothetical protein